MRSVVPATIVTLAMIVGATGCSAVTDATEPVVTATAAEVGTPEPSATVPDTRRTQDTAASTPESTASPTEFIPYGDGRLPPGCTTRAFAFEVDDGGFATGTPPFEPEYVLVGEAFDSGEMDRARGVAEYDEEGVLVAYIVAEGDILLAIDARFCMSGVGAINHVWDENGNPVYIYPGDRLRLRADTMIDSMPGPHD